MSQPRGYQESWTAKAVLWWVDIYTHSAAEPLAADRREEIRSDLYEQYTAAVNKGLSPKAVSRSVAWRAIRGALADLHWCRTHNDRKAGAMDVTVGDTGESRGLFRGINVIWAVLATLFLVGFGAMIIEFYIVHGDVLGRLEFANGAGFGVSGLLILGSATAFLIARICQVVASLIMRRHRGQKPDIQ